MIDKNKAKEILTTNLDPDSFENFDFELVEQIIPLAKRVSRFYFRVDVRGIEKVLPGPAMIVGNHNAGITFLEPIMMGAEWYTIKGKNDPLFFLVHDAMVRIPALGNLLLKFGCVRATKQNSIKIFDNGHKLAVFPGGNSEAFRTFKDRFKIDFAGHKGFARLAIEKNVPIVPMVSVGGHETFFVLHKGERLAKILKLDKLVRSKTCAISIALPWGISIGPVFHLPIPAKCEIEFGDAILPSKVLRGIKGNRKVDKLYYIVISSLQSIMDRIAAKRRFPVIG